MNIYVDEATQLIWNSLQFTWLNVLLWNGELANVVHKIENMSLIRISSMVFDKGWSFLTL